METKEKISELVKTKFEEGIYLVLSRILEGIDKLGGDKEMNASVKLKLTRDASGIAIDGASSVGMTQVEKHKIELTLFDPDAPDLFEESEAGND